MARRLSASALPLGLVGAGLLARAALKRATQTDLRGSVALITGSSRGLGLILARELARQGARLVICGRNPDSLERARRALETMGAEVLAVPCDVSDREQVQALVDQATRRFGRIDVLVNNAGVITVGPFETQGLPVLEESMAIMFWGAVYPTLAVLPAMRARGSGHIVNVTSIGGKISVSHLLPYSASKFALVGFSEGLSAEVAKDGIKVTTVVPGLMRTGSHVNAVATGHQAEEYTLFSLMASLPVTSMDAERAARQIVGAMRRGETEIILTPQAQVAARFHGLFPGLTTDILGLVDRVLPRAPRSGGEPKLGRDVSTAISESFLTGLGRRAAERFNETASRPGVTRAPSP